MKKSWWNELVRNLKKLDSKWWFSIITIFVLSLGFILAFTISDISFSPRQQGITKIDFDTQILQQELKPSRQSGWIVQFNDEPAGKTYARLKETLNKQQLQNQISQQKAIIEQTKELLIERLDQRDSDYQLSREFNIVFSGVALKGISHSDVEFLRNLEDVKNVIPDKEYELLLLDSIPLIDADDVWSRNSYGGSCQSPPNLPGDPDPGISGRAVNPLIYECITGEGITIGIIDTGVDYTHPDLGGCFGPGCKVAGGYDFEHNDPDPMDENSHGTHVAATAAGKGDYNGNNVYEPDTGEFWGVAPDATIYAYKTGGTTFGGFASTVIAAIERATDPNNDGDLSDHLDIISMSIGFPCGESYNEICGPDDPLSIATDNAVDIGIVAVSASGNSGGGGDATMMSPATSRKGIAVGNSNKTDGMVSSSSKGPIINNKYGFIKPEVTAPGADICAALVTWGWGLGLECYDEIHTSKTGTSMSAPHVSGAAALIKDANPEWTPEEIKFALKNTAIDLGEEIQVQGYGRIDVNAAVFSSKPTIARIDTEGEVGGVVDIYGSAFGDNFVSYELSLGEGINPTIWTTLEIDNSQVIDNALYSGLDARLLEEDTLYTIRLRVNDNSGLFSEERKIIKVENIEINDFQHFQEFDNDLILDISGTANTLDFGTYTLTIERGHFLSGGLSYTNPEVIHESQNPVSNGILGVWDLTVIDDSSYYKITLDVFDSDDLLIGTDSEFVYIEDVNSVHEGWPIFLSSHNSYSSLKSHNINLDDNAELIFSNRINIPFDEVPKIHSFNIDGSSSTGWPSGFTNAIGSHSTPAVGDLNNDGIVELAITGRSTFEIEDLNHNNFLFNSDGNELFGINNSGNEDTTPIISDLNNDAQLEIIYYNSQTGEIDVYDINGEDFGPYPINIGDSIYGMAAGDMNNNGVNDLVVLGKLSFINRIFIIEGNSGEVINEIFVGTSVPYNPIIADIDGDSVNEVLFVEFFSKEIRVYNPDGSVQEGWPQSGLQMTSIYGLNRQLIPSVGNVDSDNFLEIFLTDSKGNVYGWNHDGTALDGWPINGLGEGLYTQPIIADVSGDGIQDIISQAKIDNSNGIVAFHVNGSIINGFPKQLISEGCLDYSSTPLVADLDNDGLLELAVHSGAITDCDSFFGYEMVLKVWDLPSPGLITSGVQSITLVPNFEWPTYQYDSWNTGCYKCDQAES